MYDVTLPQWDWFQDGQVYSGTLCPDPTIGSLQQTTLHYKAQRSGDRLVAWCWFVLPWKTVSNVEEVTVGRFEGSPFGLTVAANWIRSKFLQGDEMPPLPERQDRMELCG